ncbi:translationally-controlled tumor protein [Streptomyces sp. NPDC088180]|uniref:translationally-controlled tumor protein n=1 Tax=Streptomyces sp. NPDC088180 TaxID=3365837 RepID=UPI00382EB8FE
MIYKDVLGYYKDELFSDAFPIEELPALYSVTARMVVRDPSVTVDIGIDANQDGESDAAGEAEAAGGSEAVKVNNLIESHRLQPTSFDKKGYLTCLKGYMKEIEAYLGERAPDEVAGFRKAAQEAAKTIVDDFDSYSFYQGENLDAEGMVVLARPAGDDTWTFLFWKHGVKAEKY